MTATYRRPASFRLARAALGASLVAGIASGGSVLVAQEGAVPLPCGQLVVGAFDNIEAVVDLDLDGAPDYIVRDTATDVYSWRRNRGDGLVSATTVLATPATSTRFFVCDLDGDGRDDLGMYGAGNFVALHSSTAGPQAQPAQPFPAMGDAKLADMDGDGDMDVVGTVGLGSPPPIEVWAQGASGFSLLYSVPSGGGVFTLADYDGDGRKDAWTINDTWVWVRGLDASGAVVLKRTAPNPIAAAVHAVGGDVDGDGDDDVVLFAEFGGTYVVARNSAGTWAFEASATGGPATNLGDLDGDGDLDGLCCGGGTGPYSNSVPSNFEVSINDGTGAFAPAFAIPGIGARRLIAATDMDRDGDVDLVAGRCVIFQPAEVDALRPRLGFAAQTHDRLYDVEGDGDPDFGLRGSGASFTSLRSDGSGAFRIYTTYTSLPVSGTGTGLTGDFDGDGDEDVLVEEATAAGIRTRLYRNTGGALRIPIDAAAPGVSMLPTSRYVQGNGTTVQNHWHLIGDWDADGDLDALVMDETAMWSKVWTNDGAGRFALERTWNQVMVLALADFNGDGAIDVLTVDAGARADVAIRLRLPGGGFGGPNVLAGSSRDARPGIADLDGDGDLDILSGSVSRGILYTNDGSGGMVGQVLGDVLGRDNVWSIVDLDLDGVLDAVAYQPYFDAARTSTVLMGLAGGGFAPAVRVVGALSMFGDVDRDGDLDAVGPFVFFNPSSPRVVGSTRQYGDGVRGKGGVIPTMGEAGSLQALATAEVRVVGVRGGAAGFFVLGLQPAQNAIPTLPGLTLWVDQYFEPLPIVAGGPLDQSGTGTWSLQWTVPRGLGGLSIYSQAFFFDDQSPASGMSQTNGKVTVLPR